jgi:Trk K+ transport system NAD-binding subunit
MAFTAIGSSYLIQYSHQIFTGYDWVLRKMGLPEKDEAAEAGPSEGERPLVVLGFHRGAQAVIDELHRQHPELLAKTMVVDFNPESLKDIRSRGLAALYGDVSNIETLERANIHKARVIISTIPDMLLKGTSNSGLVRLCRSMNPKAYIVATADFKDQAQELAALGANEVLAPHSLVGKYLVPVIKARMGE